MAAGNGCTAARPATARRSSCCTSPPLRRHVRSRAAAPRRRRLPRHRPRHAGLRPLRPAPNPASIPDHADALLTILDALGLTAPHILGHHTGALIAANLAARHPARVGKLILNGVPWLTPDERAHFATFRFAPLDPAPDGSHLTAAWAQRLRASPAGATCPPCTSM